MVVLAAKFMFILQDKNTHNNQEVALKVTETLLSIPWLTKSGD
jgi:hypothetical protein